jgi:hypothetical protein
MLLIGGRLVKKKMNQTSEMTTLVSKNREDDFTKVSKCISSSFTRGNLKLPGAMHDELIELKLAQAMKEHGEDPATVHAFTKTLLWCTEDNVKDFLGRPNFSKKDIVRWNAAIAEYNSLMTKRE